MRWLRVSRIALWRTMDIADGRQVKLGTNGPVPVVECGNRVLSHIGGGLWKNVTVQGVTRFASREVTASRRR